VLQLAQQALNGRTAERMAILHVNALDEAQRFTELLRAHLPCPAELPIVELTPGLSVHSGAGMLGVAFVAAPSA
jgi:fatty acid-binding protein DegV